MEKESKVLNIDDVIAILPSEKEVDEWFTFRSENPPYTNIKAVRAIEGANKYSAVLLQRLEKLQGERQRTDDEIFEIVANHTVKICSDIL
jgi:hypothetical protein